MAIQGKLHDGRNGDRQPRAARIIVALERFLQNFSNRLGPIDIQDPKRF